MSDIDTIQFGKMLNAVETLTKQVAELDIKIDSINEQLTSNKGAIKVLLVIAGFIGAFVTKIVERIIF